VPKAQFAKLDYYDVWLPNAEGAAAKGLLSARLRYCIEETTLPGAGIGRGRTDTAVKNIGTDNRTGLRKGSESRKEFTAGHRN
jgi:hypothetical protein